MSDRVAALRSAALKALVPPQRLSLPDWIERNVRLPDGASALPGPIRLYPFQRGIAEAIGDPAIERVTLVKPVRVGFTCLLTAAIGAWVVNDPSPILVLLPTEADARDYVVSDVEPVFEATSPLRGLLTAQTDEAARNTLLYRRFPGGSLKVVAAKAPRNLRRHTVRVLLIDEADAMVVTPEGSPLVLAERRTMSFADRQIVVGSTPLDADTSAVLRLYEASDRRVYEVPCPECGDYTEIMWSHIRWEPDRPETAVFCCPACGALVQERHKTGMVAAGRWRATAPEVVGHAGFRLNALVSPLANASWPRLAAEFVAAKADTDNLRVFVNTILAQGWEEQSDAADEEQLAGQVEPVGLSAIPEAVRTITAGVDVQENRVEVSVVGWSEGRETWVLAHLVVFGLPSDDSTWAELDELLRSRWDHPLGGAIGVDATVVDSGNWTDTVYSFCFPRAGRRVWAGKGVAGSRPAFQLSKTKFKGGRLALIGVDTIKSSLMTRLAKNNSVHFSDTLDNEYFAQLASERRVIRYSRGQPVRRFERKAGARAEALDCLVYATAAHAGAQIDMAAREAELRGGGADRQQADVAPAVREWVRPRHDGDWFRGRGARA